MHAKPERRPYFDFSDQLRLFPSAPVANTQACHAARKAQREQALQAYFARLRGHFAESFDAVTLCRLSAAGRDRFHPGAGRERTAENFRYRLTERDGAAAWHKHGQYDQGYERGRLVERVGQDMLFGRLHAQIVRLDAAIFGPHPVGTIIEVAAVDSLVKPGRMQHQPYLLHVDGRPSRLRGRFQAVYDVMDGSPLPTRYLRRQTPEPLADVFGTVAGLVRVMRGDRIGRYEAYRQSAEYRQALCDAEPRFWTADRHSIVLRASLTGHMGQFAEMPTRRAHAHILVARPHTLD